MLSKADIEKQISAIIDQGMSAGQVMVGHWIAAQIMAQYPVETIRGELGDFCTLAGWQFIRDEVRNVFSRYKAKPTPEVQLVLPGYKYLQAYYTIERSGAPTFVPLENMSDSEVLKKVAEYDRAIRGFTCHRDELMDFYRRRVESLVA